MHASVLLTYLAQCRPWQLLLVVILSPRQLSPGDQQFSQNNRKRPVLHCCRTGYLTLSPVLRVRIRC